MTKSLLELRVARVGDLCCGHGAGKYFMSTYCAPDPVLED
jgi:hypothetical protein